MRDGWQKFTLGEVVTIHRTSVAPAKMPQEVSLYAIPALDAGTAPESVETATVGSSKFLVESRSLLVSMLNPRIPRQVIAQKGSYCSTEFAVITPHSDRLTLEYLSLITSSRAFRDHLSSCAKGTTGSRSRSKAADVKAFIVSVPSLPEQERIVDLIAALDYTIEMADPAVTLRAYHQFLASWMNQPGERLGRSLNMSHDTTAVVPEESYRILGVLRSGDGFIDRGATPGAAIRYAKLTRVSPNQLVYRKLTAWERPIAVSGPAEAGGWVSNEFPVFDVDEAVLLPELLRHMCRWPGLEELIKSRLVGSVQRRKRLNPVDLLEVRIPTPDVSKQLDACGTLDSLWSIHLKREESVGRLLDLRTNLLISLLSGAHQIPVSYDSLIEEAA